MKKINLNKIRIGLFKPMPKEKKILAKNRIKMNKIKKIKKIKKMKKVCMISQINKKRFFKAVK
jgi:hypothetical protein